MDSSTLVRRSNATDHTPVLLVNSDRVEWYEDGDSGRVPYRFEPVDGQEPDAILKAVQRLIGGRRGSTAILALGGAFVHEKMIELPQLARRELREVLLRKAAKLLQVAPADTLFSAVSMGLSDASPEGGERTERWFLMAARRSHLYRLRVGLRDGGLNVKRVVAARLARICSALGAEAEEQGDASAQGGKSPRPACIIVDVEQDAVVTSLVHGDSIVSYSVLSGSLLHEPAMAMSLVQEVKSFKAGWHRTSRGAEVSEVVVVGLPEDRGEMLCHALRSAMAIDRVSLHDPTESSAVARQSASSDEPVDFKLQAGAVASIAACRGAGAFNPDLTLPIPWRLSRTVALAVGVTILLLIGSGVVKQRVDDELGMLRFETARLERISGEIPDFDERNHEADQVLRTMQAEYARARIIAAAGFPVDDVLKEVIALFDDNTALLSLQARETERGQQIQLNGLVDPNPVITKDALRKMRELLTASGRYTDVELQIESSVGTDGNVESRKRHLQFNLTATRRRGQ